MNCSLNEQTSILLVVPWDIFFLTEKSTDWLSAYIVIDLSYQASSSVCANPPQKTCRDFSFSTRRQNDTSVWQNRLFFAARQEQGCNRVNFISLQWWWRGCKLTTLASCILQRVTRRGFGIVISPCTRERLEFNLTMALWSVCKHVTKLEDLGEDNKSVGLGKTSFARVIVPELSVITEE